jgi:hypothetical protein
MVNQLFASYNCWDAYPSKQSEKPFGESLEKVGFHGVPTSWIMIIISNI